MSEKNNSRFSGLRWVQRHWLLTTVVCFALLTVLFGQPAWAASNQAQFNQTVPRPTPTTPPAAPTNTPTPEPTDAPQPAPTNTPNNGGNDGGNGGNNDNAAAGASDSGSQGELPAAPAALPAAPAPQPGATQPLTASVAVLTLNVRGGPNTSFPVIGRLTQGGTVSVLGRNATGDWFFVCCAGESNSPGWISAQYVTPDFTADRAAALGVVTDSGQLVASAPISPTGAVTGTVSATTLRVRQGPGTDTTQAGRVTEGGVVTILGRNQDGTWLAICCAADTNARGWVSAQFVTLNQPGLIISNLPVVGADALATATVPDATAAGTAGTDAAPAEPAAAPATPEPTAQPTPAPAASTDNTTALAVALTERNSLTSSSDGTILEVRVKNTGGVDAQNVTLRSVLPAGLEVAGATAQGGGLVSQEQERAGQPVVVVTWPTAAAGETLLVRVNLRPASGLAAGALLDSAASVQADNATLASANITLSALRQGPSVFW